MARRKRTYRTPVVITLAALAPGCAPGLLADGSGGTSGSGGAPSGTGGSASGAQPSTGGTATGGSPAYPDCDFDYAYSSPCTPEERCQRAFDCTSGMTRTFAFECDETGMYFDFQTEACSNPAEFCAGTGWDEATTCGEDGWMYQGQGGNPPSPCPADLPAEGSNCDAGLGFGADRTACGYPCGEDQWTVIGCQGEPSGDTEYPYGAGTWQSDGVCSAGGAGGAEP
jgi:hypothetical protein